MERDQPRSRTDIDVVLAASSVVANFAGKNAMTASAVSKMIEEIHGVLVRLINEGPRIAHAAPSGLDSKSERAEVWEMPGTIKDLVASPKSIAEGGLRERADYNAAAVTVAPSPVQGAGSGRRPGNEFNAEFIMVESEQDPAVPRELSVWEDRIICLECGRPFATLVRHLKSTHDLSELQYRRRYGLSPSYPMSCRTYVENRRALIEKTNFRPLTRDEIAAKRKLSVVGAGQTSADPAETATREKVSPVDVPDVDA